MSKYFLTHHEVHKAASRLANDLYLFAKGTFTQRGNSPNVNVYAIPRGGVIASYMVAALFNKLPREPWANLHFVDDPALAHIVLDDLIDSGATMTKTLALTKGGTGFALFDKGPNSTYRDKWLVFPWEVTAEKSIEDAFVRLLQFVEPNPTRGGLVETPARMAKAWAFWTSGYKADPAAILKTFEDGGEVYDEMIHVKNIPFYSQCEHHLAPFFGTVSFAYIPDKRIVGLSKMNRLVEVFARRLQVQERMTAEIIDNFVKVIKPVGAGIVVKARHMCMESRGVCHQGCETTTTRLYGVMKTQPSTRAEFLNYSK